MKKQIVFISKFILCFIQAILPLVICVQRILLFADMPRYYSDLNQREIEAIRSSFIIMFVVILIELVLSFKCRIRGSILLIAIGILNSIMWFLIYGDSYTIQTDYKLNVFDLHLIALGIVVSVLSVLIQVLELILSLIHKRHNLIENDSN